MNKIVLLALALPGALLFSPVAQGAGPLRTAPPRKIAGPEAEAKLLLANAPSAEEYPNAAKATLLDLATMTVRPDGTTRTVTHMAIKIFNERGREEESEVRVPYNSAFEKVTVTRARTIRPDGRIISVKPGDIRDQSNDEGEQMYSDARVKSFSLPAVDEDCILDYEYVTDQHRSQMPGHFWTKWWFQGGTDPVVESRLTLIAPKGLKLRQDLRNSDVKPTVTESADGKTVTRVWAARNVAPIEVEPLMPGADRVAPRLFLSTLGSWQDIAAWYDRLARPRMEADATVKARALALTKGKTTPEEKAKAIFYWVEEKTRYVALEFGASAYQPRAAGVVCDSLYGDCKDMTTLLVALLRSVGVTAHPVLLGAGSTEKISDDLPTPGAFNHAICLAEIGGKKFWLDATAQICPWGEIPGGDRGSEAFVIRDGVGSFETIPNAQPSENGMEQQVKLVLAPDGSAKGSVRVTGTGDVDMSLRSTLTYLPPDKLKGFVEGMAQRLGANAKVTKYQISDFRNKDVPVTVTYDVTFPSWANKSGDLLLFKARPEQTAGSVSSPFGEDARRHAIVQPSSALGVSTLEIALPAGFSLLSVPSGAEIESEIGTFRRTVASGDSTLTITTRAENRRADIPAGRYEQIRKYYNDLLRAADETVVVKKG